MKVKKKATVYVVSQRGLLIFSHSDHPEVGFQVPSGTVHEGERVEQAAVRELEEETGLRVSAAQLVPLPAYTHDMRPFRDELQERHPFMLRLSGDVSECWSHWEQHPDTPGARPVKFDLQWEPMHERLPRLLAVGQGRPIGHLCAGSSSSSTGRLEYRALRVLVQRWSAARRRDLIDAVSLLFPELACGFSPALLDNTAFGALLEHVTYLAQLAADGQEDLASAAELLSTAIECIKGQSNVILVVSSIQCHEVVNHAYETPLLVCTAGAVRDACAKPHLEYAAALEVLNNLEFNNTVDGCVGVVVELQRKQLLEATTSYTLSGMPGTIYCDRIESKVRLAETLLHESTHTWLNHAFSRLQPNGFSTKEYWSPWRHKSRPAYGIVQATLVFSILCQFFEKCRSSDQFSPVDRAYAGARLKVEIQVLRSSLVTLSAALDEVEDVALRTLMAEELNRAINLCP